MRRTLGAVLAAIALTLALATAAQASEAPNHRFLGTVIGGTEGSPPQAKLEAPCGVGVGPEGELFVSDYFRRSILGASLPSYFPNNGPCTLATDPFNLYANYLHGGVVNVASGVIDEAPATGIAVDPASFDLYVDHRTSVAVYAAPVEPGDPPALELDLSGAVGNGYGIAVSAFPATAGWIYVADAADHTVKAFDPAAPDPTVPVQVIDGAGTPAGRFVSLVNASLAIDQSNGHLLLVDNTQPGFEHPLAVVDEFNAAGLYRGQFERQVVDGLPTGIAVDESEAATHGHVYVTSGNGSSVVIPPSGGVPVSELGALLAFGSAGEGQSLEVSLGGSGEGSVTSSPAGIDCPGACEAELNSGSVVSLTATPAAGSVFAGWSGACTGSGSCQVVLEGPTAVNAEFAPAPSAAAFSAPLAASAVPAPSEGAVTVESAAAAKQARHRRKPAHRRHRVTKPRHQAGKSLKTDREEKR
jgi:hypothetical protein